MGKKRRGKTFFSPFFICTCLQNKSLTNYIKNFDTFNQFCSHDVQGERLKLPHSASCWVFRSEILFFFLSLASRHQLRHNTSMLSTEDKLETSGPGQRKLVEVENTEP